jgi:tellurite resistance protein TehA-like permease
MEILAAILMLWFVQTLVAIIKLIEYKKEKQHDRTSNTR